jgi:spectinomycin phosphotransferase
VRLGRVVAAARPELVLCHADLHLANLLVGSGERLRVVDRDGLQLAPRVRDLLFVAGPERARFFDGYGPVALDRATEELRRLFAPGDVVEAARVADRGLTVS